MPGIYGAILSAVLGGFPTGNPANANEAAIQAQKQSLEAKHGPMKFMTTNNAYGAARGVGVLSNVFRSAQGVSYYVNAKTGVLVDIQSGSRGIQTWG